MITNEKTLLNKVLPQMPLVLELVEYLTNRSFRFSDNVLIFGTQHLMFQTLAMCWAFKELGISYDRIALCGKSYSTHYQTLEELRHYGVMVPEYNSTNDLNSSFMETQVHDLGNLANVLAMRKKLIVNPEIIVLDDGGLSLTHVRNILHPPYLLSGVEQTASGFWQPGIRSANFPIVDIGASAVKRLCEPPLIVDSAMRRVLAIIGHPISGQRCGVIGLGHIGKCIAAKLLEQGALLSVYDLRNEAYVGLNQYRANGVHEVIESSNLIFGCAGTDITTDFSMNVKKKGLRQDHRHFFSLSSGDDEFYSLKINLTNQKIECENAFNMKEIPYISGHMWGSKFTIWGNGYPINFDNTCQSVPLHMIQGTVCALIVGVCQSWNVLHSTNYRESGMRRLMLDDGFQAWLFNRWNKYTHGEIFKSAGKEIYKLIDREFINKLSTERTDPPSLNIGPTFDKLNDFWNYRDSNHAT